MVSKNRSLRVLCVALVATLFLTSGLALAAGNCNPENCKSACKAECKDKCKAEGKAKCTTDCKAQCTTVCKEKCKDQCKGQSACTAKCCEGKATCTPNPGKAKT